MRMQNVTVTLKVSLAVSYKAKYNFTMQSSNTLLDICPNELKNHIHIQAFPCRYLDLFYSLFPEFERDQDVLR